MIYGKWQKLLLASSLMSVTGASFATVNNGDFETWTSNTPSAWSTIDSGITLAPESNIVKSGSYAAKVTVNTASQSSTDIRQSVAVEAGQTYQFSTWVYHTDGGIKARLVVDGYQNYSNAAVTQQWQQISYQYTASTTTNIDVGLRFYDVSGFDGSEVVYVDAFLPSSGSTPPPSTGCNDYSVSLSLQTDSYGEETSWQITNSQNNVVESGNGYQANTQYNQDMCLASGDYSFTIFDSYGDGICCNHGNGSYSLTHANTVLASGASFQSSQTTAFTLGGSTDPEPPTTPTGYYASTQGLTGFALKTELHNIIKNHNSRGYSAIWGFYDSASRDKYFENDNTILDRYSENPTGQDSYNYIAVTNQCGSYNSEADCYNREHSFPKSWFGGKVEPMNSDIHHIFATDGYVNAKRGSYPFGEVSSASFVSNNGSKLGSAASSTGYNGTVFEPIDEFKGDFARAYFYMATRYQNVIGSWQGNSSSANDVLNGTTNQVFENWVVALLLKWHNNDPVSQLERDRNQAAYDYQGNRNPFVDHPEFVDMIW
ncbi:endonuclease [Pseudoalteromonas spongiae]|uniref:endonuclease n=1 Tax=Pseudoalteromonas spongiae TaxID=298657 RepID=UPI000C2D53EF|nr:endonuclease [Pseudoalteromonas spongiae]